MNIEDVSSHLIMPPNITTMTEIRVDISENTVLNDSLC